MVFFFAKCRTQLPCSKIILTFICVLQLQTICWFLLRFQHKTVQFVFVKRVRRTSLVTILFADVMANHKNILSCIDYEKNRKTRMQLQKVEEYLKVNNFGINSFFLLKSFCLEINSFKVVLGILANLTPDLTWKKFDGFLLIYLFWWENSQQFQINFFSSSKCVLVARNFVRIYF